MLRISASSTLPNDNGCDDFVVIFGETTRLVRALQMGEEYESLHKLVR